MRLSLAVLTVLLAPAAFAQGDARIDFLKRQLLSAKDPRARAQTALVLGASKSSAAVDPLCQALKDPEGVVRSAAAKALGDLRELKAVTCLRPLKSDPNQQVQFAAAKAIETLESTQSQLPLYISISPVVDKSGGQVPADALRLTEQLLRQKLTSMGVQFAPVGENKLAASSLIRSRKLKGWMLIAQLQPHATGGLKLNLLCLTYPDQAIKGDYTVKASGAKLADLLKLMVPKVVEDAADDLEWSSR